MAFPDGWTKRWPININADSVTTGLVSDWPCLVTDQHFPAAAWANLQATGADLRFSSDEAGLTELYYDAPRLDVAGQEAHLYVRVPSLLASEDTVIYGWCGNAGASAPSAAWKQNTYQSDIVGWWPMEEGTGITVGDRTSNANHGTMTNMDPGTDWVQDANGDWAIDFDGTNDCIDLGTNVMNGLSDYTVLAYVYGADGAFAKDRAIFGYWTAGANQQLACWMDNYTPDRWGMALRDSGFTIEIGYGGTATEKIWTHLGLRWDGDVSDAVSIYVDGVNVTSAISGSGGGAILTSGANNLIGADQDRGNWMGRIAHIAVGDSLTSDEIACHHLMLSDPATWATAGALESTGAGGPYLYHGRALGRIGPSMAGVR